LLGGLFFTSGLFAATAIHLEYLCQNFNNGTVLSMGRSMIKRLARVALKASERSAQVLSTFPQFWHGLLSNRPDRYWPERHYMRGPGPKWREKHAPSADHRMR
jgi:hypothetical protein